MKVFFSLLIFGLTFFPGRCQTSIDSLYQLGVCTSLGYAIPSIQGLPRSKGLEAYQERVPSYTLTSHFENGDSSASEKVRRTKSWKIKVRAPVMNRDGFKLIVGFQYYHQEFAFKDSESVSNIFHQSLQNRPLRSVGTTISAIKPFVGNRYLAGRVTYRLNGDLASGNMIDYLKSSYSLLYGIKKSATKVWGLGVSYSNTFGRSRVYPLLFLNQKFQSDWAIKILLPVSAQLLYIPNDKNTFYFSNRLEGDNYNLNFASLEPNTLYLEKADIKSFLTYEREIYDFIWLGVSAGIRFNFSFDVADSDNYFNRTIPPGNTDNLVISNDLGIAPFVRFGLFLVAPRSWLK